MFFKLITPHQARKQPRLSQWERRGCGVITSVCQFFHMLLRRNDTTAAVTYVRWY
jgi:hypothetical protein